MDCIIHARRHLSIAASPPAWTHPHRPRQALASASASDWDPAGSVRCILSHRLEDGSLGDLRLTAAAVTVLVGRSLLHVTDTACHRGQQDSGE